MRITVLNENTAGKRGFLAEHGLSLLIEAGTGERRERWLFDTGQTDVFLKNADRLGVDLFRLDGIVLSHGHFDHCGGLEYLAKRCRNSGIPLPPVYVRAGAFLDKTAINSDQRTFRHIGIPWKRGLIEGAAHITKDREKIGRNAWVLGNVPYTVEEEGRPEQFFIGAGPKPEHDYMEDEQMLLFEDGEGLFLFAGCCHAGILNCLAYVRASFPGQRLRCVFAGMHLSGTDRERLTHTVEALAGMDQELLIPVHCTGLEAIGRMKTALGERCVLVETGKVIEMEGGL